MQYKITYRICGKEYKIRVQAKSHDHAEDKVRASLTIIRCDAENDKTLDEILDLFRMKK
jgi:hypothetical protein